MKLVAGPELTQQIYERLCLTSALVIFLIVVPVNLIEDFPLIVHVASAAFGAISLALYYFARRGHCYPFAFLAGMVVTISIVWFPNAGSIGSIPFYFLPAIAYAAIFFRGRVRLALVLLITLDGLGLMWLEWVRPDL
ncbi:MAG: hypothetical protein KAY59_10465, partial [Acidobacteria bacterium]|nr:hypothetical protein [Acidobacteriota bacterium]